MDNSKLQKEPTIFLSYRREDSGDSANSIYADLVHAFGPGSVYIDSDQRPGDEWRKILLKELATSSVVIVVIGPSWLKIHETESGQRRLDAEGDLVRLEIEEAIAKGKIVMPLLVRDATLPEPQHLPASIRGLRGHEALSIPPDDQDRGTNDLIDALRGHGLKPIRLDKRPREVEPSMLGVLDYFYRRIGQAAAGDKQRAVATQTPVKVPGISDLWLFIDDFAGPITEAPPIFVPGQLSPYAPLLFGNPFYKRRLHLELRQNSARLVEVFGNEFGDLLNGLMSYSAGQMVIRPYFRGTKYGFLGLYESIVRNSIPVMIDRKYYDSTLAALLRQRMNTLDVHVAGFLAEIPNYMRDALDDFGITDRLRTLLSDQTLERVGHPNYALVVNGDADSFVKLDGEKSRGRYLDGDIWATNAANSLVTRFIDISSREDMRDAVVEIEDELRSISHGRGIVSSFDTRLAPVKERVPDRVLTADQL